MLPYHICNLIFFPSSSIVRILKSIPEHKKPGSKINTVSRLLTNFNIDHLKR